MQQTGSETETKRFNLKTTERRQPNDNNRTTITNLTVQTSFCVLCRFVLCWLLLCLLVRVVSHLLVRVVSHLLVRVVSHLLVCFVLHLFVGRFVPARK